MAVENKPYKFASRHYSQINEKGIYLGLDLDIPVESRLVLRVVLDAFLGVHLTEDHEEVVAFVALDEPGRTDERLDVSARISTFGAREHTVPGA